MKNRPYIDIFECVFICVFKVYSKWTCLQQSEKLTNYYGKMRSGPNMFNPKINFIPHAYDLSA